MNEETDSAEFVSAAEAKVSPRAARIKYARAQDYFAHLAMARRAKFQLDQETTVLDGELVSAKITVEQYAGWADARIDPRRRFPMATRGDGSPPRRQYILFLDECGVHHMSPVKDHFPYFCLCGIIVDVERFATFDRIWKTWKAKWLGSSSYPIHEPNVRRRSKEFHNEDPIKEQQLLDSLEAQIADLEFHCIAAVIDKKEFAERYPSGSVDDFLPKSTYLMCVDFVFERFVHFLYSVGEEAYGLVVAESRGAREDTEVHAEFLRLHVEGTQWHSETNFRAMLRPYIEFKRKERNDSGLQIADLAARPIIEKVKDPGRSPERWEAFAPKFYDGLCERRSSYGLKIFPTPESEEIFGESPLKANEAAEASPSADQQVLVQ